MYPEFKIPKGKTFNLANAAGRKKFDELLEENIGDSECADYFFDELCGFEDYLETKKSPVKDGNADVLFDGDHAVLVKSGVVFTYHDCPNAVNFDVRNSLKAVLVEGYKNRTQKNWKLFPILNADDSDDDGKTIIPIEFTRDNEKTLPSVSFRCLSRFFGCNSLQVAKKIASKEIVLIDHTENSHIKLTKQENDLVKKGAFGVEKLRPPEPGYALVTQHGTHVWHRSGSCLFHDTKKKRYLLLGQDEDTYFGVQLPGKVSTVKEGYDSLVPGEVKGKFFKRQGEWFFIRVPEKEVPILLDCCLTVESGDNTDAYLPLETDDSNKHSINDGEVRIGKDGKVYIRDSSVSHEQHAEIWLKDGWWTPYRNTALASFSEEGVD